MQSQDLNSVLSQPTYASFKRRLGAYSIDRLILLALATLFSKCIRSLLLADFHQLSPDERKAALLQVLFLTLGFIITVGWLYSAVMESSSRQGTVGKMAVGIKVTDLEGNRISFGRATARHFAKVISTMTLMIGFLMIGFTEYHQGLHDFIASTVVEDSDIPAQSNRI